MTNVYIVAKLWKRPNIVTIPLRYVLNLDLAKSLNNRINRNQKHVIFWSEDDSKEPNFNLPLSSEFNRSTDSCFEVKFLKVFANRESALIYANARRQIDPAIYNTRRLREKPYPAKHPGRILRNRRNKVTNSNRHGRQNIAKLSKIVRIINTPTSSPEMTPTAVSNENDSNVNIDDGPSNMTNSVIMNTPPGSTTPISDGDDAISEISCNNAAVPNDTNEDVICVSNEIHLTEHRPIKECDVISGRHTFTLSVCICCLFIR